MTGRELFEEYLQDIPELNEIANRFNASDYVFNYLRKKRKENEVKIIKHCFTRRNNKYIGLLYFTRIGAKKDMQWKMESYFMGILPAARGICTMAFYTVTKQALIFTPHFFKRYKERFSEICDWKVRNQLSVAKSILDIASVYFSRNLIVAFAQTDKSYDHLNHLFAPVSDGINLVQWNKKKKVLQSNTFINWSMVSAQQLDMIKDIVEMIDSGDYMDPSNFLTESVENDKS